MTHHYERALDLIVHGERALLMLPLNALMVARIHGTIDSDELRSAVERLRRRHALLAVRFVLEDDGGARYETADVGEIPLRVVDALNGDGDGDGDGWLQAVRQELIGLTCTYSWRLGK